LDPTTALRAEGSLRGEAHRDLGMAGIRNVRLSLPNEPENVLVVRQMLTGLAEALDIEPPLLNSLSAAVSEACNNVVLHAYGGQRGPLEIEAYGSAAALRVLVCDQGVGFTAPPRGREADGYGIDGVGLLAIDALTQRFEIRPRLPAGTEVEMQFWNVEPTETNQPTHWRELAEPLADTEVLVEIRPVSLGRRILPRLFSALAARAHFPIDRISDAMLLADALPLAVGQLAPAGQLRVAINAGPRKLELRIGPLGPGHASALKGDSSVQGIGSLLDRITNAQSIIALDSQETLALELAAASR
jgi:serine/threonine-protein kinase RsbW